MKKRVIITKVSPFSGKRHSMAMVLDPHDYDLWLHGDSTIQRALPYLTPDEREFLLTGITPDEWETLR